MQYLKVNEYYAPSIYWFVALGTITSLFFVYMFFTTNWFWAILLILTVDGVVLGIHKYIEGNELRMLEINDMGIVTNKKTIPYESILKIETKQIFSKQGRMQLKNKYITVLTNEKTYSFNTTNYSCGEIQIINCLNYNLTHLKNK